ncbi:hypothetical protein ABPG74_005792 [Tetrahymena malaccensis]
MSSQLKVQCFHKLEDFLRSSLSSLTDVFMDLSNSNSSLKNLGFAIEKCLILQNLSIILNDNYIDDKGLLILGVQSLDSSLQKLQRLSTLQLDLSQNSIDQQGVKNLTYYMAQYKRLYSLKLNLSLNKIPSDGASDLDSQNKKTSLKNN